MCLFGSNKVDTPAPPPVPSPPPVPTPSDVGSQVAGDLAKRRRDQLRYGLQSTIKTGGRGITGYGAELSTAGSGKNKLGA